MDDINDYRPGVKARNEEGVRSLLQEAGLYKSEIRELAKRAGVTNWNKTPSCSLASRFPTEHASLPEKSRSSLQGGRILLRSVGLNQYEFACIKT